MDIFLHIFSHNVLPLALVISVGVVMQRNFSLDIKTLSKLNFYVFSPAIIFQMLYQTSISVTVLGQVAGFIALFLAAQYALAEIVVRVRKYRAGMRAAMRNSVLFYNSGNFAIPLNQLVFANNPYTLSIQILVMMTQNLIPNTYGVYSVNAHKADWRKIARTILSLPSLYVIPLAFALRGFDVSIPGPILTPIGYLANAFFGTALLTLGVQLGNMKWRVSRNLATDIGLSVAMRLVAGPLLAWGVVSLLGIDGLMASALIVSSAVPTSLSSVLLAVEFDNEAEFASQAVFVSTTLSVVTITAIIWLLQI